MNINEIFSTLPSGQARSAIFDVICGAITRGVRQGKSLHAVAILNEVSMVLQETLETTPDSIGLGDSCERI